jgi:L-fucose isomerase-like protein
MKLGIVAIAQPTFDVTLATANAEAAVAGLVRAGHDVAGTSVPIMDAGAMGRVIDGLSESSIDGLVILQATFSSASLAVQATEIDIPVVLWAFPEERTGGRLRLNSYCGINLAGFALTNLDRPYRWMYRSPDDPTAAKEISSLITAAQARPVIAPVAEFEAFSPAARRAALDIRDRLRTTTVGRVGDHPEGFQPCSYDAAVLHGQLGVRVDDRPLPELFARAERATASEVSSIRDEVAASLVGIDDVDQVSLDRSLRLKAGLQSLVDEGHWAGVATRCWPEAFTEFGGAVCAPMAMLTERHTPGSCEADVYGNVTGLILQWLGDQPSFVADLVHLDAADDTGVFWHCGLAPVSMAAPDTAARATIHSNRRKPLLNEFPLKPGRVTLARVSRSRRRHRLVIGGAEMLAEPLAFSGTAGVARFDRSVGDVMATVLDEGLEHHYGIVYADVREELRALASLLDWPVVEL